MRSCVHQRASSPAIIRIAGTQIDAPMSAFFPDGSANTDANVYETTSLAAFGQLIWNIDDEFSATLGLRYTYEEKNYGIGNTKSEHTV